MTTGAKDPGNQIAISTENSLGATIYTSYATRQVKAYPVFESEIDSFNMFNSLTQACFSGAGSMFFFGAGIRVNASFAGELPPEAMILNDFVAPLLVVVAIGTLLFGFWARSRRTTIWAKIKAESESEMRPGSVDG